MKYLLLLLILLTNMTAARGDDYRTSPEYQTLRDSMALAFNNGDSTRFFPAVRNLQAFLLSKNDQHAYYTQRCNEIVFLMNRQKILEAYKLAQKLSDELRKKKLDKEMYMSYNMLGHLNNYCGNREAAKENFEKTIQMMEKAGYYESMPPIYMNIVNVQLDDDPEETRQLLDKALQIARQYSPERVFDIETRQSLLSFNEGDMPRFLEGYKQYRKGVDEGKSSVHGRMMEIYYEAYLGNTEKAVSLAKNYMGSEAHETVTMLYEKAGHWKEAFESLKKQTTASDSINNVILRNSMQGFNDELRLYDMERQSTKVRTITMGIIIILLLLLISAMVYIIFSRRRHILQLTRAYEHALESDKMKAAFIRNMSHEVRTPLNVIAGFAQILANPDLSPETEKRKEMAKLIQKNNHLITNLIDELLELAINESSAGVKKEDLVPVNDLLRTVIQESSLFISPKVSIGLDTTLPEKLHITTHRDMLKRSLAALVNNATKYTTEGSITLKADVADSQLTLVVQDTGCGIPENEAEHIFERFVKLDTFKEGIGLGLSLCRSNITRLGGSIQLDTDYHDGARFVVTLPLE